VPTARAQEIVPIEPPAPATALPPLRPLAVPREAAHSAPHRLQRPAGTATVTVEAGERPAGLGVAVLDGESGARLGWRPLAPGAAAQVLSFDAIPAGDHVVALAIGPELARYGYVARATLPMTEVAGRVQGTATLPGAAHELRVRLANVAAGAPPRDVLVTLARTGDARWLLPAGPGGGAAGRRWSNGDGDVVLAPLGAGSYVLRFEGFTPAAEAQGLLTVDVPQTSVVTITGVVQ
jgi:hypothetical protein